MVAMSDPTTDRSPASAIPRIGRRIDTIRTTCATFHRASSRFGGVGEDGDLVYGYIGDAKLTVVIDLETELSRFR